MCICEGEGLKVRSTLVSYLIFFFKSIRDLFYDGGSMIALNRIKITSIRGLTWLLLLGSLWGMSEVFIGGALYNANVPRTSVYLSVLAVFIMVVARGALNKPGSSTAVGIIAAAYKLLNAAPFFCHIYGILFLAIAFDLAFSLLGKDERRFSPRTLAALMAGVYGGYILFALFVTWIIRYPYWSEPGLPKVLDHVFINGSLVAITSFLFFRLGLWIGLSGESFVRRHPRWASSVAVLLSFILWTLGQIAA